MPASLTVLCPLAAERQALARSRRWRAAMADRSGADLTVAVVGPGSAVASWIDRERPAGPLVLVGVAGGLTAGANVGAAGIVDRVVDPSGREVARPLAPAAWPGARWTVASADAAVSSPAAKAELARRSGASIVDMESAAFARAATARGLPFAIVRGVSDGADDALPDGVERLVDRDGQTRIGEAIRLIARHPTSLGALVTLGRRTQRAMDAAAEALACVVASFAAEARR